MLSIVPLKSAAQALSYYMEESNYYAKDAEEAKEISQWSGKGAVALGLNGYVEANAFKELLEGKLPSGQQLGRITQEGIEHRPGYDLTFSAPKSISILAEVCGDKRLYDLHNKAVDIALNYLERNAAQTRTLKDGSIVFEQTGNLLIAKFQHGESRELDPQLHTHAVVLNATLRKDGQWRSLSSEEFFEQKMLAGMIYRSILAYEVQKLGYAIETYRLNGQFEIKGVPKELMEHFSKRRQQIEALLDEKGMEGAKASWVATMATRENKQIVDINELRVGWRDETKSLGYDWENMIATCSQSEITQSLKPQEVAKLGVHYALQHLSEREAVFSQSELLRHALAHSLGKALPHHVERGVKQAYQEKLLIHRQDLEGYYWTTPQAIALEKDTIAKMLEGRYSVAPMMSSDIVLQQLSTNSFLNLSQKTAVHHILTSPDRILGIQGYAGVGKTTMLSAVKAIAEKEGFILQGLAPSAAAAQQLQNESGIQSQTLAKFLIDCRNTEMDLGNVSKKDKYEAKKIFILDEASMVPTKQMNELLAVIHYIGGRLVTVGDTQQLGAVEAGKPFYQLQKSGMQTAVMKDILRQKNNPILLAAVHASIKGDIKTALEKIGNNVHEISNKTERLIQIADDYLGLSKEERAKTLVLTSTNEDRQLINRRIRVGLKQESILQGQEITTNVLVERDLTQAQKEHAESYTVNDLVRFNHKDSKLGIKKDDYLKIIEVDPEKKIVLLQNTEGKQMAWQPYKLAYKRHGTVEVYQNEERQLMLGDSIRWLRNDKKEGLLNSTQATITAIDKEHATLKLTNGTTKTISLSDNRFKHWDHAYVLTVHNAQGQTCHRVFAQDESHRKNLANQQSFYVKISRAGFEVKLYVDDKQEYLKTLEKYTGEKTSAYSIIDDCKNNTTLVKASEQELQK